MTPALPAGKSRNSQGRIARALLTGVIACGLTACADAAPDLPPTLKSLAFDTLYTLGASTGEPWESFEGVWDVEADSEGRLAILDVAGPAVHLFDAQGAHIGSIDQAGLDEGQLDGPAAISWSRPGELLVWDPGASWVSRFQVAESSEDAGGVRFVERWRAFAFGETGFCASGDRAWLSYWQDGFVLHEVGPQGIRGSFGPAPDVRGAESLGPDLLDIATEELTPSALVCTSDGILDVGFVQSIVRRHDPDGSELWSREIDGLRPIVVYSDDGIGLGRAFDSGAGSHLLRSVVPWGPGMVLLQHDVRTREIPAPGEAEVLESRLIDLADGSEVARSLDVPAILAAEGPRLYLVRSAPWPEVTVVEVRPSR